MTLSASHAESMRATAPGESGKRLLQRLRAETRPWHDRLEQDLDLLRPDLSAHDLRSLLERFHGFCEPWERRAAPLLDRALPGFYDARRRTPRLLDDLRHHGCGEAHVRTLPRCERMPSTLDLPSVLGTLYVLEGATLGGQILSRHFERRLALSEGAGYSFFRSYGEDVGRMWRGFGAALEACSSPSADDAIVRSAVETFSTLHAWLCRPVEVHA